MTEDNRKSILQMCNGAFQERADYEMTRLIDNILDPNTDPTAKRKLTLTLELASDGTRQNITVKCSTKSTLAQPVPVATMLYVAGNDQIVEMTPQLPGQLSVTGEEQEAPAMLRIVV